MKWSLNWDTIRLTYKANLDISLLYEAHLYLDQVAYIARREGIARSNFTEGLEKEHSRKS
jgi:hypothetical protein